MLSSRLGTAMRNTFRPGFCRVSWPDIATIWGHSFICHECTGATQRTKTCGAPHQMVNLMNIPSVFSNLSFSTGCENWVWIWYIERITPMRGKLLSLRPCAMYTIFLTMNPWKQQQLDIKHRLFSNSNTKNNGIQKLLSPDVLYSK